MKFRIGSLILFGVLAYSACTLALELELIPGGFPADQKPAFSKERAALVSQKNALDQKVSRYNAQCSKPQPYQAQKCSADRLNLFQQVDAYKNKVEDFNKRVAVIDRGPDTKNNNKNKQAAAHE